MSREQDFPKVDATGLRPFVSHIEAGARALRREQKRLEAAFCPTDAAMRAHDARRLRWLASWIDRGMPPAQGGKE